MTTTTTSMSLEAAGYIIRRKPQTTRDHEIVAQALDVLGKAGMSDREASMQAQRELEQFELILLSQARVSVGMAY